MFGPTPYQKIMHTIDFSHRSSRFSFLMHECEESLHDLFKLNDYDIIFLSGSGTLAMESIIFSYKYPIRTIGPRGKFLSRWEFLCENYNPLKRFDETHELYCAYETSIAKKFEKAGCIVDAVCSFPFYDIPKDTLLFATVSNKMLGAAPVISIVGIRRDSWHLLRSTKVFSYLNLSIYREYKNHGQTPFTPAYSLLLDLNDKLKSYNPVHLSRKIIQNSKILCEVLGKDNIVEQRPVKMGQSEGGLKVVESGLSSNDWVITGGIQRAVPGQKVSPDERTMKTAAAGQ